MNITSNTFLAGLLLLAASACSSSSGGGTGSGPGDAGGGGEGGVSGMQACTDSANASCKQRNTCSLDSFLTDLDYGTEADCVSRTQQTCANALGAKGTGTTPATIEACVAAYPTYECTNWLENDPPAACVPPKGTLTTGAPCGASAQCESTFCAVGAYAVCGTCQPLPAAGAACQVNADCGRGLSCTKAAGSTMITMGVCTAFVASGGACLTGTSTCAPGLACVGDDPTTKAMGMCETQAATVGAACDGSRKTAANCNGDLGLVCIPSAKGSSVGTCQTITLAMPGQPCGDVGSNPITAYAECQTGFCQKAASTDTNGTCVANIADEAACSTDPTTPPCNAPAKCVPASTGSMTGTCKLPNASTCM
jgi:hypothetical protein